jgi:hypothetical protein
LFARVRPIEGSQPVGPLRGDTEKSVSVMPRGSKIRRRKKSSSDIDDATSTTRPSTSVDME